MRGLFGDVVEMPVRDHLTTERAEKMSAAIHTHKRWSVGPFASGAYSETGGHWKVLGLMHLWLHPVRGSPAIWETEWSLLGMFACRWGDNRQFDWAFFSMAVTFKRARWRYGKRENARLRREAKKRFDKARSTVT